LAFAGGESELSAGGHHVARELAEELQMAWIHVPAGIPRGQEPKPRQWWLDFESKSDFMTRATQASPYSPSAFH